MARPASSAVWKSAWAISQSSSGWSPTPRGAAPPPGTGKHRYFIAVNALDIASVTPLGVTPQATPAALGFFILEHTLARGVLVPWADT